MSFSPPNPDLMLKRGAFGFNLFHIVFLPDWFKLHKVTLQEWRESSNWKAHGSTELDCLAAYI